MGSSIVYFGGNKGTGALCKGISILDTSGMRWKSVVLPVEPEPRELHTTTCIGDKLYMFGGTDGDRCFSETWELGSSLEWREIPIEGPVPSARAGHTAVEQFMDIQQFADVAHFFQKAQGCDGEDQSQACPDSGIVSAKHTQKERQ